MKKKILICCNAYPPNFIGGAELIAHYQARQLQDLGYEVIIFTGDVGEVGKRHSLRREDYEGLQVYRVRLTYKDYDPKYVNFSHEDVEKHFKMVLKKFSPDVVHFHNIIGLSVGLIHLAKKRGIKTVLTLHDHWGFCFKNTLIKNNNEICKDFTRCSECMAVIPDENNRNIPMRMRQDFIKMQLEDIDAFISPSQYLAQEYIHAGIPQEKMHIIWNGIDVGKFSRIKKVPDPNHIRFSFIGYFGKHKGIDIIINALQYLENKQKLTINLIGDGNLFTHHNNEINGKKLNDIVKFWGRIKNIEEAYAQTDVFILPSIWPENHPVSITEAMSAKIPVIASDIGGIPELVEHGKTGFLFEKGDARDLAKKMNEFIKSPEKIQIFGENAFDKIKIDTLENQVKKIIDVYNKIPEGRKEIADNSKIIVCHGKHVDSICAAALKIFSKKFESRKISFILSDWLYFDQLKTGEIFWIVDENEGLSEGYFGLRYDLPLLVPEKMQELKNLCVKYDCGLFYQNSLEAGYALQYLLDNEKERIKIIKNGVKTRSFPDYTFRK